MPVDPSNPDKVDITNGSSSAEIYYYGATVTSWKPDGVERIFLSKQAVLNGTKAIRGGIPLVFPHFGTIPTSKLPQHGFARTSKWVWLGTATDSASETTVQFGLKPENVPTKLRELWPHDFQLTYAVTLTAKTLKTSLSIKNPSSTAWDFTTLLHTYFSVQDIAEVSVKGLSGIKFVDKVAQGSRAEEARESITVAGEVDRVYENVKNDDIKLEGTGIGGDLLIHKDNFPDVVVWNPWTDKAKAMADFGDEEFHNMICVEVGSVAHMIALSPGKSWEGSQTLTAL